MISLLREGESIEVRVEKIAEDIIMNISFKDGEEVVGGGDYFVPAGVQNYSVLERSCTGRLQNDSIR